MKVIRLDNRREHIITPWLSFEEAAAYCGMCRHTFSRVQKEILPLPAAGGTPTNRRYLAPVVDAWLKKVSELKTK